jgi:hypothetical protein
MDSLLVQPITLIALAAGIVVTAYEMRTALEPVHCPECPHCRAAAREREARQRDLQEQYARRHRLDDEDDDRRIG